MAIDVSNKFPYNAMTDVTIAGVGDFVRIPKIFVKNEVDSNGLISRYISNVKKTGFHCHPAFMQNGHERNAILIGKYMTSGTSAAPKVEDVESTNVLKVSTNQLAENYSRQIDLENAHCFNIYEQSLLSLLMLIEYSTTNFGGIEPFVSNVVAPYRGIKQILIAQLVYGIDTKGGNSTDGYSLRILDNLGNYTMQDTEIKNLPESINYPITLQNKIGEHYNLNDVFIGKTFGTLEQGNFGVNQRFVQNQNKFVTAFGFLYQIASDSNSFPFRICKFSD